MEQERNPATDPDGEELLSYDHVDAGFEADQDPEFEGVDITQSDGPDLEAGDDLDTGAAVSDRRNRGEEDRQEDRLDEVEDLLPQGEPTDGSAPLP